MGVGAIHHVAFRIADDAKQLTLREGLLRRGLAVSDVRDRQYFHSIYFVEPGGVLFEAATDGPGFALDEEPSRLGRALKLPPWLEPEREKIEGALAPVSFPGAGAG
jgi:glyoxalase family protein